MFPSVALYYPYIHFRDSRWLKTAVLLWDEVARIVPEDFHLNDDPEVQELSQFIRNIDPSVVTQEIAFELESFLRDNADQLQAYTVHGVQDDQLGFLYHTKIRYGMAEMLQDSGLARLNRNGNPNWVGLHPSLAAVYMSALANRLAKRNQLEPATSDDAAFCSVGGIRECAQSILDGDFVFRQHRRTPPIEIKERRSSRVTQPDVLACIFAGFQIADAGDVPAKKLVRFLEKHPNEKVAFRHYVQDLRAALAEFAEIDDAKLRNDAISKYVHYQRMSVIDSYREQLRDAGIQTLSNLLTFRAPVGAVITGLSGSPGWGALATAAAIGQEVHRYATTKRQLRRTNAAATYLLDMKGDFSHGQLAMRLRQRFARSQKKAEIITLGL
jgi:hypothetical protein